MALPTIDFRSFTVADIRECLDNGGYITTDKEFEVAENGAFKYIGYSSGGAHRYLVGFVDDSCDDECYLVSRVFVEFDAKQGKFVADYSGVPDISECTEDEMTNFIEKICN